MGAKKTTCSIPGCLKARRTRGLCDTHYQRSRRKKSGAELRGPVKQADTRSDAVAEFARVAVKERTRTHFERIAATEGKRVTTYIGELLDSLASR